MRLPVPGRRSRPSASVTGRLRHPVFRSCPAPAPVAPVETSLRYGEDSTPRVIGDLHAGPDIDMNGSADSFRRLRQPSETFPAGRRPRRWSTRWGHTWRSVPHRPAGKTRGGARFHARDASSSNRGFSYGPGGLSGLEPPWHDWPGVTMVWSSSPWRTSWP